MEFEERLLRDPSSLRTWSMYVEHKSKSSTYSAFVVYERALELLPRSYKLWKAYLSLRIFDLRRKGLQKSRKHVDAVVRTFERALLALPKMPILWQEFLRFLVDSNKISRVRTVFNNALRSLPLTQHRVVWAEYLDFVGHVKIPKLAVSAYRRYLQFDPSKREDFVDFLIDSEYYGFAAQELLDMINDSNFVSTRGKSKFQLWNQLCDILSKNPTLLGDDVNVEGVLRSGMTRYPAEISRHWCALAEFNIRKGKFERARDVFEEAMESVTSAKDFSTIFNVYSSFEENMIAAKLQLVKETDGSDVNASDVFDHLGVFDDIDLRLSRLENLLSRRPFLLNQVLLRQNPNNVNEWMNRVNLFKFNGKEVDHSTKFDPDSIDDDTLTNIVDTFTRAVTTIDASEVTGGKLSTIWIEFARFYETFEDFDNCRAIFKQASEVAYKHLDDLASVWCAWVEFEVRHKNFKEAINMLENAVALPSKAQRSDLNLPLHKRLYRSTKLWSLYADLEESLGTLESAKAVYEQMISLKVVTPQHILNYALFLQSNRFIEDSFRAYEKGLSLFRYPHNVPIWTTYLKNFIEFYGSKRLERARDLFEEALQTVPEDGTERKSLFLLYADLEERHGMVRKAMEVYDRACSNVAASDRYEMFQIYISKATEFFGAVKTRAIYEKAIRELPDSSIKSIAVQFALLEKNLGEIDRSRAILTYASQFTNPKVR